jgi:glycine/D-amino acid oxidase-like deaminating enzyme
MAGHVSHQLRRGLPLWLRDQPGKRSYPSLRRAHRVDVAIVGGGITGALAALAFADAGVSTLLLEAGYVSRGSTAASSALLLQEPDKSLSELSRRYGPSAGRRLWELTRDAVADLTATLRHCSIECELIARDAVYFATREDAAGRLHDEYRRRAKAGFVSEWLTAGSLRTLTGIVGHGAIRTTGNAQLNPYKASVGLMRAAASSGARVFEQSRVTRIEQHRNHVRIHTAATTVDAMSVVIATGYATPYFRPLAGRFRMYRTYVLATEPLKPSDRRALGLGDVMVWDTGRPYRYARWTADHRLLLGGGDRPVRTGQRREAQFKAATSELREQFETLLPALANIRVERAWDGLFAITPDSLPYVGGHRRYPRHLFALGYGGNGMAFASLVARMLLEQWQGKRSRDHQLFAFGRVR